MVLPGDPKKAAFIRWIFFLFIRRYTSSLPVQLEAQEVLKEADDGIYGAHQPGPKLKDQLHWLD